MARYIDADKAKDLYIKTLILLKGQPSTKDHPLMSIATENFESYHELYDYLIDSVPTADVAEVRHGKWGKQVLVTDEYGDRHIGYICPVCKKFVPYRGNYCLECGARMDGDGK